MADPTPQDRQVALGARLVALVALAVTVAPVVLAGSVGWSLIVLLAGVVLYFAGAVTVIALSERGD